jgi:hypothetical protein
LAMMATATFVDHPSPPQSLLLYPTLIDQTTLSDLPPLVRNRNYHAHRDAVTRSQLDQIILANALFARLTSLLFYAHTLLVRVAIKSKPADDNASDFSVLNQGAHELQKSITCKFPTSFENVVQPCASPQDSLKCVSSTKSFLDELSPTASNTLVNFLCTIRADPTLISSRLLQAKDQDLDSLVSWKPHHHANRSKSTPGGRNNSIPTPAISPVDYLTSFHRYDPVYVLTSVIFSISCDSESLEHQLRLNVWSTCLARMVDEKRGDRIVFAVMDIFCGSKWQSASCFETVILDFLQNAAKLRSAQAMCQDVCEEDVNLEIDPELRDLCDKTLIEILDILNNFGGIPSAGLQLANAIFFKCVDKDQAKLVLFKKWFIEQFVSQNLVYPEVHPIIYHR